MVACLSHVGVVSGVEGERGTRQTHPLWALAAAADTWGVGSRATS